MAKSMWNGTISFGMVNIPVKMYTAVTPRSVRFHQINSETGNRVRQKRVDEQTGDEVLYENIVKGFEVAPDTHVIVTDDELAQIAPKLTKQIELETFVDRDEIPLLSIEKSYFLGPDKVGGKAYRLLADALAETGRVGIGSVVIRSGGERLAVIDVLDDGTLTCKLLVRADEVNRHDDLGVEGAGEISDAERTMAVNLVNALAGPFEYETYKDEYRERVAELIEAKSSGKELIEPTPAPQPQTSDILAALEASLVTVRGSSKTKARTKTKK